MVFFSLFSTAFSSVFYGVIVTAAIMAILYVVLKSISRGIVSTPVFFITGAVLAILLVIQSSLMIGAMQAKDAADSAKIYLDQLLESSYGTVGAQDSQKVLETVTTEFPLLGTYFGFADFSGNDVSELSESMHETMTDYLNSYIWHRVWWMLGIIVMAVVIACMFEKNGGQRSNISRAAGRSRQVVKDSRSRDERGLPRYSSRQRISRR